MAHISEDGGKSFWLNEEGAAGPLLLNHNPYWPVLHPLSRCFLPAVRGWSWPHMFISTQPSCHLSKEQTKGLVSSRPIWVLETQELAGNSIPASQEQPDQDRAEHREEYGDEQTSAVAVSRELHLYPRTGKSPVFLGLPPLQTPWTKLKYPQSISGGKPWVALTVSFMTYFSAPSSSYQ